MKIFRAFEEFKCSILVRCYSITHETPMALKPTAIGTRSVLRFIDGDNLRAARIACTFSIRTEHFDMKHTSFVESKDRPMLVCGLRGFYHMQIIVITFTVDFQLKFNSSLSMKLSDGKVPKEIQHVLCILAETFFRIFFQSEDKFSYRLCENESPIFVPCE